MGDCFSCLLDNTVNDLQSTSGFNTVNNQVMATNVVTSVAHATISNENNT
jgi:hypothetical protein